MWSCGQGCNFTLINEPKRLTTTLTTSVFDVVKWSTNTFVYEDSHVLCHVSHVI